jgi:non-heme chloroperoxidase
MRVSNWWICVSAVALAELLLFSNPSKATAAGWKDPSSHVVRFIEVEPGVKLEVLDWGGSGEPIFLLSGHGDTGHVFDDFGPQLAHGFHVYAITRRGFGASSQPTQGYGLTRLVEDIKQVTDALKIRRVNLVGHSIAGDEMTRFALSYPDRVGKLVYLEAAYDRVEAKQLEARFPKLPPSAPNVSKSESAESIRASVTESEILMPEAAIRSTRVFGADGRFVRPVTPDWIVHAVAIMVEHPNYKSIRAPIFAIYAVYQTPAQLLPRYNIADRETRQGLDKIFDLWQPFASSQRELLRDSVPGARLDEIHGASHYIFSSHKDRVLREVAAFFRTQ